MMGSPEVQRPHVLFTEKREEVAIEAYAVYGTLLRAGKAAGVHFSTLKLRMKRSVKFTERMHEAKEQYIEHLEDILDTRIKDDNYKMNGVLLMFKLKGERPHMYREQITGTIDHNIRIISAVPRPIITATAASLSPKALSPGKKQRGRPRKIPLVEILTN